MTVPLLVRLIPIRIGIPALSGAAPGTGSRRPAGEAGSITPPIDFPG